MPHTVKKYLDERYIHLAFQISLWTKGLFALTEVAGGLTLFFVSREWLAWLAGAVTKGELAEDPHDFVANFLLHSAQQLSISTQHFTAAYLLGHGVIKLWLIIGLLRERLWYYPTALVVFGLFVAYQIYRFEYTHSLWLLVITAVDIIVIGLTWHEYRYWRRLAGKP